MCLWTQEVDGEGRECRHPVLPDGCVDIVWIGLAAPVVAGPATRSVIVPLSPGTKLRGVRFRPGWAAACLGIPVDELRDQDVALGEIWRNRPKSLFAKLSEAAAPDAAVRASVQWLAQHPAGRIGDLARITGLGERQLHRRFLQAIGYAPKTFQRIMRFQRLLSANPACGKFASAAMDAGYADQAHMCREVRALGGGLSMSDLFKTGAAPSSYLKPSMAEWLRRSRESAHHPDHPGRR